MAYRIEYPGPARQLQKTKHHRRRLCLTALLFLALLVSALIPSGRRILTDILVPGEDAVTQAAIHNLVDEMSQGEDLEKAFWTFCKGMFYENE